MSKLREVPVNEVLVRGDVVLRAGADVKVWSVSYSVSCSSDEQLWERVTSLEDKGRSMLSGSWVARPSVVVVTNLPTEFVVNPTKEQEDDAASKIIEVTATFRLSPGQTICLPNPSSVEGRTVPDGKQTKVKVVALP